MRTTLQIDEDVLLAARSIATYQNRSIGAVISELARSTLHAPKSVLKTRNGVPLLPRRGAIVTLEMVNAVRDETD